MKTTYLYGTYVHGLAVQHSRCGYKYELIAVCDDYNTVLLRTESAEDMTALALAIAGSMFLCVDLIH